METIINKNENLLWCLNSNADTLFVTEVQLSRVSLIRHLCLGKRLGSSGRVRG